jgi:hypothetical protein
MRPGDMKARETESRVDRRMEAFGRYRSTGGGKGVWEKEAELRWKGLA